MAAETVKGKTENGFEFEVDKEIFDDWEMLEILREVDNGKTAAFVDVLECIFPDKSSRERLKDFCRDDNGRVPISKMIDEIFGIFKAVKGKNS